MLIKLNPLFHTFARQKEDTQSKELTREQRITGDRIVITILFLMTVIGAIIFS